MPAAVQQRGMPEADARWLFQQLLVAVEYCHLLGIANRDVKVPPLPVACANSPAYLRLASTDCGPLLPEQIAGVQRMLSFAALQRDGQSSVARCRTCP